MNNLSALRARQTPTGTAQSHSDLMKGLPKLSRDLATVRDRDCVATEASYSETEAGTLAAGLQRLQCEIDALRAAGLWRQHSLDIFDVMERTSCEHTHSNVISWLLDPLGSHGLGDAFLRSLVRTAFEQELSSTSSVIVRRECEYCDIVVQQGREWLLVIENKINSSQGDGQLGRYVEFWKRHSDPACRRYFLFLTRNDETPDSTEFVPLSYDAVRRILLRLEGADEARSFLKLFADHIWFC